MSAFVGDRRRTTLREQATHRIPGHCRERRQNRRRQRMEPRTRRAGGRLLTRAAPRWWGRPAMVFPTAAPMVTSLPRLYFPGHAHTRFRTNRRGHLFDAHLD
jgi:hypothetical protein